MIVTCRWCYEDCSWYRQRTTLYDIQYFVKMCMLRQDDEYSTAEEETEQFDIAARSKRCIRDWNTLSIMRFGCTFKSEGRTVYEQTVMGATMRSISAVIVEHYAAAVHHKTIGALGQDDGLLLYLRKALHTLQVPTQNIIAMWQDRRESDNAQRIPMAGAMCKRMSGDPLDVAIVDDLLLRVFALHVVGVQEDCGSLPQRTCCSRRTCSIKCGVTGATRGAVGSFESCGYSPLHDHWLAKFLLTS